MIFHENRLLADGKMLQNLSSAAVVIGAFRDNECLFEWVLFYSDPVEVIYSDNHYRNIPEMSMFHFIINKRGKHRLFRCRLFEIETSPTLAKFIVDPRQQISLAKYRVLKGV